MSVYLSYVANDACIGKVIFVTPIFEAALLKLVR
jgi:hypothetical protein